MSCLNPNFKTAISRNPRYAALTDGVTSTSVSGSAAVLAHSNYNSLSSVSTSRSSSHTRCSRISSRALLPHQVSALGSGQSYKGSLFQKLKKLNKQSERNLVISAVFGPIIVTSIVLEEEQDVARENIELLNESEFNRHFIEVAFARSKVRDFRKLIEETEVALKELQDTCNTALEVEAPPEPAKNLLAVPEPLSAASQSVTNTIDWNTILTDVAVEEQEMTTEKQRPVVVVSSRASSGVKTVRKRKVRMLENKEANTESETKERENTTKAKTMQERLGFLSDNNERVLSPDEEYYLSRKVKVGYKIQEARKEMERVMSRKVTNSELAKKLKMTVLELKDRLANSNLAKKKMIQRNMRLVFSIALNFTKVRKDWFLRDMVGEGLFGLIRAIERFDPDMGFKFSTYAHWWIRQAITRALGDQSKVVRIPMHLYEYSMRINRFCDEYLADHGRQPSVEEISLVFSISTEKIARMHTAMKFQADLDAPLMRKDPQSETLCDSIADKDVKPLLDKLIDKELRSELEAILATLPIRERYVIRLRYGLDDGIERTLEEVGRYIHVTRERVRQLELKGMRKLRQRGAVLQDYGANRTPKLSRSQGGAYKKSM